MPQDMKVWRANAKRKLKIALGSECVGCGEEDLEKLTIEHKTPLTDEQHSYRCKIGVNRRLVLYRKEKDEGLIELLCQKCQSKRTRGIKLPLELLKQKEQKIKNLNENSPF